MTASTPIDSALDAAIRKRVAQIPILETLNLEIVGLQDGICKGHMPRIIGYDGIYESVHGGLLMTVADTFACFAIMTRTGPDQMMTTTDMQIRFLAPCLTDVHCTAQVIKFGRTMCPVQVDIYDSNAKHIAIAQVNYMMLNNMPSRNAS